MAYEEIGLTLAETGQNREVLIKTVWHMTFTRMVRVLSNGLSTGVMQIQKLASFLEQKWKKGKGGLIEKEEG